MSPNLVMAKGPFSLPSLFNSASSQSPAETRSNQQVAEQVAGALRQARLTGRDINIEYKNGVATLTGMISDSRQKATAEQVVMQVASVNKVDNRLGLMTPDANQAITQAAFQAPTRSPVQQANFQAAPGTPIASPIQQVGSTQPASSKGSNQQVANSIAQALQSTGLSGYDIGISYKNGVASLEGSVGTSQQRAQVSQVVSRVPGVRSVNNQLGVSNAPVTQTAAFQQNYAPPSPGGQPQFNGQVPPRPMMASHAHPGPGPVNPVYNQPNLPNYAWPTYAASPNYSAVTYPKQYSANAFPYIGPFYPYPQVPLGWRSSTLEWDDGQWQLKFSPQTERWWWFMSPKNWN
ncbi:MAG: BON domain-containing protein [Planctomycetaceae bacterium]|nr:BON domain-containing protein [Planctomycetaceae bacterium]